MRNSKRGYLPSARSGYRLPSPFVTDEENDRPVSALDRTSSQKIEIRNHVPLKFDSFGRELPPGKGAGIGIHKPGTYSTKAGQAVVPGRWTRAPAHSSVAELKQERKKEFVPHHSFDLDGDGVVSSMDYFYATQFDKDRDGKLNAAERKACMAALKAGFGEQYYHVRAGGPSASAHHRIMQRRGQILAEERGGWLPLHQTYTLKDLDPAHKFAPYANAGPGGTEEALDAGDTRRLCKTMGVRTQSELMRARKKREVRDLSRVGGVPVSARDDDDVSVASFVATKPFASTAEFETTAPSRSRLMRQRQKDTLRHVLTAQGQPADLSDTPRSDVSEPADLGVTQGLATLSRTRGELLVRKKDLAKKEAEKFMPTKAIGVHKESPPSYAKALGSETEWFKDTRHLARHKGTSWEGSELDGSTRLDATGGVMSSKGRRVDSKTGAPILHSGLPSGDHVEPRDSFKTRTTSLQHLPLHQKKRMEYVEKPTAVCHVDLNSGKPMKSFTNRRWTDLQIEYKLSGEDKSNLLDSNGKSKLIDPAEYAPMYSSFSNDRIYREPRRHVPGDSTKKMQTTKELSSRRRRSVYGTPIAAGGNIATDEEAGSEAGDVFDTYHQVDYSRRPTPYRPSLSRSQSAPDTRAGLPTSPIAASAPRGGMSSLMSTAPGFGHDGAGALDGTSSRPSTQPTPEPASLTRALSRQGSRQRRAGSGLAGSMRGATLGDADVSVPVAGVRASGFQRVAASLLVME